MDHSDVIILGAGLAGLTAGYELALHGKKAIVIELTDDIGGLAGSLRVDGMVFDYGPHRFYSENDDLLQRVIDLLPGQLEVSQRRSRIRLQNKFFQYPLKAQEMLTRLNPVQSAKAFLDYLYTSTKQKIRKKPDVSFEDWVVHRFGRSLFDIFFGPYTEKIWGMPTSQLSADWAAQRISLINLWDVFIKLVAIDKSVPRTYASAFHYPKDGIYSIAYALKDEIEKNGGKVITGCNTKMIEVSNDKVELVSDIKGQETQFSGDFLISTIPITTLVQLLNHRNVSGASKEAAPLSYRAIRFVHLAIEKERLTQDHWIYFPEKEFLFSRISESKNFSYSMAPPRITALTVEFCCHVGDMVWNAKEESLVDIAINGLRRAGLLRDEKIIANYGSRQSFAYPIYTIGYKKHLQKLLDKIHDIDQVITCGRQGLFKYGNMDHAMEMGFKAADHIINGIPKHDILMVASEKDYIG